MSVAKLHPMGDTSVTEEFRCRVYADVETEHARFERLRSEALAAAQSPDGLIEAPAYDKAIEALIYEGLLNPVPERVPAEGGGYMHRWRVRP